MVRVAGISGIKIKHMECIGLSCGVYTAYCLLDQVRLILLRTAAVLWSDMATDRSSILRGWSSSEVVIGE
jgi:hypothetical protein